MKHLSLFVLFLFVGCLCVFSYRKYTHYKNTTELKTPISTLIPFSLATPPKASLKGKIVSFSPPVTWQSRDATEEALLVAKNPVLQGEDYWTGESGNIEILFPSIEKVHMLPKSHIGFVQTLPTNFVMVQERGEVIYTKLTKTTPVAIRVLRMLIAHQSGEVGISINDAEVSVAVKEGSVTLAYNNEENISTVITVEEEETFVFDNERKDGSFSL